MIYQFFVFLLYISKGLADQILVESISTDIDKPNYNRKGSTEGNTQLFISGAGFSETPENNIVVLISQTTSLQYNCKINGAQAQMITCYTSPAPAGNYNIQISKINPTSTGTQCNQCNFVYSSSYTPIVNYVIPRSQQPGSFVAFNSYPAVKYVESIETFNLGEFFCDRFDFVLNLAFTNPTSKISNPHCRTARVQEAGLYNISMTTDYGNSLTNDAIASSYDIANNKSYQFRVVPTILNMNSNRGSGAGQLLEIEGYGFSNLIENNDVTVEGRQCKILKATNSLIQCEVQPGYSQNKTYYAGPSGLKYELLSTNETVNDFYTYMQNRTVNSNYTSLGKQNLLETEFVGYEQDWTTKTYGVLPYENYASYMNGYFIAPKTGSYQFRFSANDQALVYMSSVDGSTLASDMTKILEIQNYVTQRNYMNPTTANGKTLSAAMTLTKGEAYYTEIYYKAKTGDNGFTLSVETPLTDSGVNTIPEIRQLTVNPNITVEKIQLNISNAVDGNFRFTYNNIISDPVNLTEANFNNALNQIKLYGYVTNRVMYLANGTVTTNQSLQVTTSWDFILQGFRTTYSVPQVITTKLQGSGVSYNFTRLQAPSASPTGTFEISHTQNGVTKSVNVSTWANGDNIKDALITLGFSKFIKVSQYQNIWWSFQNLYNIEYYGYAGTLGNGLTLNLTNIQNFNNNSKSYEDIAIRNGTLNQFFEPVPAEMWAFAETKPSVIVTTNKIKSSCPNQNCVYDTIDTDVPVISAYTWTDPQLVITLAANTVVNSTSTTVSMNNVNCVISAISATSITCRFPVNSQNKAKINAGSFKPKVLIKKYGYALYDSSIVDIVIPLVCVSYSPQSINALGGAQIYVSFTGVYQKNNLTKVYVGGYEVPNPQFFYSDNFVFFDAPKQTDIVNANYTIALSYNGQFVHCNPDLQMTNPNGMTITSISPQKTMPTFKGDLIINGTNFGTNKTNIQVKLLNQTATKEYILPVFKVTDTQITAYLPGGEIGTYKLVISKLDLGYNNAPAAGVDTFEYDLTVTNISPKTCSINGGLNLTVTGTGFNTQLNRNQIFFYVGNENVQCIVKTATATQLTCEIPPVPELVQSKYLNEQVFIEVDQALMFNATCTPGQCIFNFTNTNAVITGLSKYTNINLNDQIYITGANITAQDQLLLRDSITKEIFQINSTFVNATSVHFNVSNLYYGVYDVILSNSAGYSNQNQKIEILPKVSSWNQQNFGNNVGKIILTGFGFPKDVKTEDLIVAKASQDQNMTNCVVVNSTISQITCLVQQFLPANSYIISYKKKYGGGLDILGNFNVANQAQTTSVSTAVNGDKITVTIAGTFSSNVQSFQLIQEGTGLMVNGTMSNLIQSSSQITATFDLKVSGSNFQLFLLDQNDKYVSFQSADQQKINIPLSVDAITPIISSFAGGNSLTITGKGLENSKVYVCDQISDYECKQTSNANGSLICQTPQILTQQSVSQFQNAINQSLSYTTSFDNTGYSNQKVTYDQDLITYYSSSSSSCFIDLEFGSTSSVHLQSIKFFVSQTLALNKFEGALIQGYLNNNWVTLMNMTAQNLVSGWNTYNSDQNQYYSKIRFTKGSSTCQCRFSEIEVTGSRYFAQTETNDLECPVIISSSSSPITQNNIVNFKLDYTPLISSITPNQGTAAGGTSVTLAMSNQVYGQGQNTSDVQVIIDNINCPVTATNSTHITCTTGARPLFVEPKLEVIMQGRRSVLNPSQTTYLYIDKWSEQTTWGGAYPPTEGNVVVVPKGQNVLLDISTPKLNTILVEGRMIIDDADITLQSTNILVQNGGYFQAGTPENPIQNKVNIILYGDKVNTKQLPMYGNKVIGVMNSRIEIHGKKRNCPWTYIASSINKGDISFMLMNTGADWQQGEKIVIASTSFDMNEAEEKYIVSNVNGNITVDSPFEYFHYSAVETYGNHQFPMRAEVALLSRNIVFKGADEDSLDTNYGAHIMMMGSEKSGTIGRFSNLELTQVGQSTIVGRYPIHYHKCGQIPTSYVDNVVCHNSFARFVTLHGVSYVKVTNSVAYNAFGHQYFIEDGSETKNTLDGNLAMNAKQIWTLTNTDVSVANYWVTNPDNLVKNCNSAGTMFYGFWYELMEHPTGPTTDVSICPTQTPLLGFFNNTAHSSGKFGLRIKRHAPVTYPCQASQNDNLQDSWAANPPIMANYKDFKIWKSVEKGIQAEHVGSVKFSNMMVADSGLAGIDIQIAEVPNQAIIQDILVIGASNQGNPPSASMSQNSRGLYLPRTDYVFVSNITFYNFGQQSGSAAIQTASTSENQCQRRQDGATYPIEKITFVNVTRKVIWNGAFKRDIIQDLDGSFTGNSQMTWILRDLPHLRTAQCTQLQDTNIYGGAVVSCQNTFMRKISFYQTIPSTLQLLPFRIVNTRNNISDETFQTIQSMQISVQKLAQSWSMALQSGEQYHVQVNNQSKWQKMNIYGWDLRNASEPLSIIQYNVSTPYELFDANQVTRTGGPKIRNIYNSNNCSDFANNVTLSLSNQTYKYGDYAYNNGTMSLQVAINGNGYGALNFHAITCRYNCPVLIDPATGRENFFRKWSDPLIWPEGKVPQANEDVLVPYVWQLILDVDPQPIKNLELEGYIILENNRSTTIQAKNIWVKQGAIQAGDNTTAFTNNLLIELTSTQFDNDLVVGPSIYAGNNVMFNSGNISLYGKPPRTTQTRLTASVSVGDKVLHVEACLDWKANDKLIISTTEKDFTQNEIVTINSIEGTQVSINEDIKYFHYGNATTKQYSLGTLDMRASVAHLTRNIVIKSSNSWGCRIYSDKITGKTKNYEGQTTMIGVEVQGCGQAGSGVGALDVLNVNKNFTFQGSSLYGAKTYSIRTISTTGKVSIENSIIANTYNSGFQAQKTNNILFENNVIIGMVPDPAIISGLFVSAFDAVKNPSQTQIVKNNIIRGIKGVGFTYPGYDCSNPDNKASYLARYSGNQAGQTQVGLICYEINNQCVGCTNFTAYGNKNGFDTFENVKNVTTDSMLLVENQVGSFTYAGNHVAHFIKNTDHVYDAMPRLDCASCYQSNCGSQIAFNMPVSVIGGAGQKPPQPMDMSAYIALCSESSFGMDSFYQNIEFINYNATYSGKPACQANRMVAFDKVPRDINSVLAFKNTKMTQSDLNQFVSFRTPDPKRATWEGGCGKIWCTGYLNVLISDTDGSIFGSPTQALPNNNYTNVINSTNCVKNENWNGYKCSGQQYGVLRFYSMAWDARKVMNIPVLLRDGQSENNINMLWEWHWLQDGSPKDDRLQAYWSLFQYKNQYEIIFPGNVPSVMKLLINRDIWAESADEWLIIHYQYQDPSSFSLKFENGTKIENTFPKANYDLKNYTNVCGKNLVDFQNRTLTMVMNKDPNCVIVVTMLSVVKVTMRFSTSFEDFYKNNGAATLVDKLSTFLGVGQDQISIVSVRAGSTVIDYHITPTEEQQNSGDISSIMTNINSQLSNGMSSGGLDLTSIGTVTSYSSTVQVVTNSPPPVVVDNNNNNTTSSGKLNSMDIGLIVFGSLFFIGVCIAIGKFLYNKKHQKPLDLKDAKQIQTDDFKGEQRIMNNQVSDRQMIEIEFNKRNNDDQQPASENALFKIKNIGDQSNRVQASEQLANHLSRPSQKDRNQQVKTEKQEDSIFNELEEITKNHDISKLEKNG